MNRYVASAPRGLTDLLALELIGLGAINVRDRGSSVSFEGDLAVGYRACLWSRVASRVLRGIASFELRSADDLYAGARAVDWREHLAEGATLACEFSGQSEGITHSNFGALKLKDAICDQLRDVIGQRPDIETAQPSVRIHAHAHRGSVMLTLDMAGEGLHRRGYRREAGEAPLRENVAAGILLRSGWPAVAAQGGEFLDPVCGAGTLVIEAAMIAADIAPQLHRDYFGFLGWRGHDAALWDSLRAEALARAAALTGPAALRWQGSLIRGTDRESASIEKARSNARRAGVAGVTLFEQQDLVAVRPSTARPGLLCANPPYGVRLGGAQGAREAHRAIGTALRERFVGWQAAVLTGDPKLGLELGLRAYRTHVLWNGAIECRLLRVAANAADEARTPLAPRRPGGVFIDDAQTSQQPGARMFANRLRKNLERLAARAAQEGVSCFRIYDADMPEYSLAIDLYAGAGSDAGRRWLFVQEYAPPRTVDPESAKRRRDEALSVMPQVTGIAFEDIHLRVRRRQRGTRQYEKLDRSEQTHEVAEAGLRLWVNFTDYLDTGLFLDHRRTRARVGELAAAFAGGCRFLNLFAYTGSATVYAAARGARSSLSVDMSATYLQWARRNLDLNSIAREQHELLQQDCLGWLREQSAGRASPRYDLIFLDPPTFSNSARMQGVLDLQRDHAELIGACMALLAPQGCLMFSTNAQRFKLEAALEERFAVRETTRSTLPFDFERNPKIHRCFEIQHRTAPNVE